ncbi:MAG: ABC transporter permease [Gemmobacter sp.]
MAEGRRAGPVVLALVAALAAGGPRLGLDPFATDVARALAPPSAAHPLGTDHLGRDVLARVIAAARVDLGIAVAASGAAALGGTLAGALAGLAGGGAARIAARGADLIMVFPVYLLALVIVLAMGNGVGAVIVATAVVNLPYFLRLAAAVAATGRAGPRVDAARMAGMGRGAIIRGILWPDLWPLVLTQGAVTTGWAMLNAAGLSFIGIGVAPPAAEWGIMLSEGARHAAAGAWWVAAAPLGALVATAWACHATAEAIRVRA